MDYNGDRRPLEKSDILVCYSTWHLGEWHEVKEHAFELLPPHPNPKYGVSMPRVRVTMFEGGLICVFSRKETKPFQLVQLRGGVSSPEELELSRLRARQTELHRKHERWRLTCEVAAAGLGATLGSLLSLGVVVKHDNASGGGCPSAWCVPL